MTRQLAALGLAATLALTASPVLAQSTPSLWDFFRPERLMTRAIQSGVMALRTQMDVRYGGIEADPLGAVVTLTDVQVWPLPDWEGGGDCRIDADRIVFRSSAVDETDLIRIKAQAGGVSMPMVCLPPDQRQAQQMLGMDRINLDRMTIDLDYTVSTAGATVLISARARDLADISASIDFDYLWFDGRKDMENPDPVIYLNSARVVVDNLGVWEKLQGMAPPELSNPATAAMVIQGGIGQALQGANGGAALTDSQTAFVSTLAEAWTGFLANPSRLVVETGFENAPVWVDVKAWEDGPAAMFDALQPRAALATMAARSLLPSGLFGADPATLSGEDQLYLGVALATGQGAPRNLDRAETILTPLAEAGNGAAALALARAVESRNPEKAYSFALRAAETGERGAAALLDRVEAALPFARVLELQAEKVAGVQHPVEALQSVALVRDEAVRRMSGTGRTRSYGTALIWALIGTAAGDGDSADILADIDARLRLADAEARAVWNGQEAAAVQLAHDAWSGFDLPAKFGGAN